MPAAAIGAVAAVGGAAMQADAASDAASAQRGAARDATNAQMRMYNQTREDQAPFRELGYAGANQLAMLLGLNPVPTDGGISQPGQEMPAIDSYDAIRRRLLPSYTSTQNVDLGNDNGYQSQQVVNNAGLEQAIKAELARQQNAYSIAAARQRQQQTQQQQATAKNPLFGSLLKEFTGKDLASDPGYQFRLGEGMQALDRSASARGGMYSGAQLKGLQKYGQDFASNEFTNAFNRNLANRQNTYNMLSGVTGTGQIATNQVAQQGLATGQMIGSNMIGAGNARASSYLAQGNALTNALNQGVSAWNNQPQQSSAPTWAAPSFHSSEWWRGGDGYAGE